MIKLFQTILILNIKMYEIKRKNCYKYDVETINDSDGIHF